MAFVTGSKNSFTIKAYIGDNKTLLAFNFASAANAKNLAGFSIRCQPPGQTPYFLFNDLKFPDPSKHAQVSTEDPRSSVNAPFQKYRWVHVLSTNHQGLTPAVGNYTYTVTPRFFGANGAMQALDASLSASVTVPVGPFKKGSLALGFTRGYMQSQAFAHHFGIATPIEPPAKPLQFDTSTVAGTNNGQPVTFEQIYGWMGATARQQVFAVLNTVLGDTSLHLDVFAYDLDEPDVVKIFLQLAAQGRIRIILDNASLHVTSKDPKTGKTVVSSEDAFTTLFKQQAKAPADIRRGCFARFSHDKIFIVSKGGAATQVLTGSTNFSITGLYVNANHVLVFNDATVAGEYAQVFQKSWDVLTQFPKKSAAAANAFSGTSFATQPCTFQSASVPKMSINFSPHTAADATKLLNAISSRVDQESTQDGSVLFAVMQLTGSDTPVYNTLNNAHTKDTFYSYGISDAPDGTHLYAAGSKDGVLVTGKAGKTSLPPPFDQVKVPPGHEIHDKFVVCGLNGKDPVVYCGSSNLATGGEEQNGDNLLEIHDADVATAFAIEALLLVDHYNFLDRFATAKKSSTPKSGGATAPAGKGSTKPPAPKKSGGSTAPKKSTPTKKTPAKKSPAKKSPAKKSPAKKK
jgi:hypothetical protein